MTDGIGQCLSTDLKGTLRSLYQDALGPSFEKGCSNVVQQLNSTFQVGTQQCEPENCPMFHMAPFQHHLALTFIDFQTQKI